MYQNPKENLMDKHIQYRTRSNKLPESGGQTVFVYPIMPQIQTKQVTLWVMTAFNHGKLH